jgi:hypothetical protein
MRLDIIIKLMFRTSDQELQATQKELQTAESELAELKEQLQNFEAQVDARLGSLLDQLSELNAETEALDAELRHIREERLFGRDLMQYLEGAPMPAHPINLDNLPPVVLPLRACVGGQGTDLSTQSQAQLPDIKAVYRRLARRYHPDLARSDTDRAQANDQMKTINQAYAAGDLPTLMRLAGMSVPYGVDLKSTASQSADLPNKSMTELEQAQWKLREVYRQISRLSSLPIVKLSLDVKLARHQGRDLLSEMSGEMQYKVARKMAERDYLQSQIKAARTQKPA